MKDKLLRLKPEIHLRLKRLAVEKGLTMGEMVESLMDGGREPALFGAVLDKHRSAADQAKLKLEYEKYCAEVDSNPNLKPMIRESRKQAWREERGYEPES